MKRIISLFSLFCLLFSISSTAFAEATFWGNPEAIEKAAESVLMLTCYDSTGNALATGSGFVALDTGVVVTNYHVIEGDVAAIQAHTEAGLYFDIDDVLCYDIDSDIAILKTNAKIGLNLLATASSSSLLKGSRVVAIGSPQGFMNTVSEGIYSGIYMLDTDYLLFSASISHGSSGGALFNEDGKVVGVTAATWTEGQNLNLAVPIEKVEALWERYVSGTYNATLPEESVGGDPSSNTTSQPVTNPDLFGAELYLTRNDDGSYSLLNSPTQKYDKILVWDKGSECYYDSSTKCWIWYNTDVEPEVWQYWYEGISSEYEESGWMEYDIDEQRWYIEASYGRWIEVPSKYDISGFWYISSNQNAIEEDYLSYYFYDVASLVTEEQWEYIEMNLRDISEQYDVGVYIVTLEDYKEFGNFLSFWDFSQTFYMRYNLGIGTDKNGLLLIMSMADRDYSLLGYGADSHYAFTDFGKRLIEQSFLDDFKKNDWYTGFVNYTEMCEALLYYAAAGTPIDEEFIGALEEAA